MKSFPFRKPFWVAAVLAAAAAGWMAERAANPPTWTVGGFVRRLYQRIAQHRVTSIAGGVTFFVLLALFPALAALVSIYGLYADPATLADQLRSLATVLPGGAITIIGDQLARLSAHRNGTLGLAFAVGVALSLWSANSGMKALFDALNIIHDQPETRGLFALNAITLLFTLGLMGFFLISLSAIVVVPLALRHLGFGGAGEWLLGVGRWPILFIASALILALIYRFGPCCTNARWRWITWGSATAAVAWIAASMLFSWYAANFGDFNRTYGALGAAVGFMTWNWLVTIVILIGAEIDAEIAQQPAAPAAGP